MDTELFENRAVFKIGTPVRVKGIGFHFDPAVTHDLGVGWVDQPEPDRLAVFCPLPGVCRKRPFATVQRMPVFTGDPSRRFFRMSAFGPCPQALPNQRFHLCECALGGGMAVIVGPAPDDGIEHAYQIVLPCRFVLTKDRPNFFQERMRVFLRGFGE